MAENKITVRFAAAGHEGLRRAVIELDKAMADFQGNTKKAKLLQEKLNKQLKNGVGHNRLLGNSFATLRSKLLLFNFAMGMGIRQLGFFAKEAGRVQDMERAFTNLSGGTEKASIAVGKLKQATNETMSEFDLFQQANNAMILGVSKNSDEMAHMFDVAQRLGAALGKDTKQSVESLITGIGRQSRLMLDNIGIIVKSDEAYQAYADRLGVAKDQLTDTQKKQAFLNATMEAAELKLESVGKEVLSYNSKLQIASARMADMRVAIGRALLPTLSDLAVHFTDTATIKGYALAIGGITTAYGFYNRAAIQAAIATQAFKVALQRLLASTGIGLVVVLLGELATRLIFTKEKTDELTEAADRYNVILRAAEPLQRNFSDGVQRQIALTNEQINSFSMLLDPFESLRDMYSQTSEGQLEMLNANIALIESMGGFTEEEQKLAAVYDMLLLKREKLTKKTEDAIETEKLLAMTITASAFAQSKSFDNAGKAIEAALRDVISTQIQMAIMGLMSDAISKFGWFGVPLAATAGAVVGSLVGQAGRHWKFEDGGLVGGRRHSQGGTMIEAEQGEFVMSRNAVNAVGIETMNRINAGGGAGNINISFTGNVMSQDFIENEAIPQIKEAIRRGADIGVS
tara:strand:+ start:1995 stop:3884 length:1890 start_codon:yes stop_codon:yes gene_type:complete